MAGRGDYRLGSIWIVGFDPSEGTEIRKTRPAVILSGTIFNAKRRKVTVLPLTSARPKGAKIEAAVVEVPMSAGNGLSMDSRLICIEPMTFDKARLTRYLGQLESNLVEQSQAILRRYLSL